VRLAVEILPEAEAEIEEAFGWYELQRPGLGRQFLVAIDDAREQASGRPFSFPTVLRRTRRTVIRRFPYLVFYVVEQDRILVTGVFHAYRDPGAWSDRLREVARPYRVVAAGAA
jgi:plasmid stabilization system protein ParE